MSDTDPDVGLSLQEAAFRQNQGLSNAVKARTSRSVWSIIAANIFTLFNGILAGAMTLVLIVGSPLDALFGGVMVINALTGIVAEFKAKRTLDKVAILASPTATVLREGKQLEIPREEVVWGDIVCLSMGEQIPTDGQVLAARGLAIDESMLTGESVPVIKSEGDLVLAGTSVVFGSATFLTQAVGEELYSEQMASEVKQFSLSHSELRAGIDRVLRWISWAIIPTVLVLVWSQVRISDSWDWSRALILAVAGVVGMIPQGLVLLTSVNFALAAATLARKSVLVQELPAVEILARVDVLCTDKTGTLTTGTVKVRKISPMVDVKTEDDTVALHNGARGDQITVGHAKSALATLVAEGENATAEAIREILGGHPAIEVTREIPFNSSRKWSACVTTSGTWVLGAPEIVLAKYPQAETVLDRVEAAASNGERVLVLAFSSQEAGEESLPEGMEPSLLIMLEEELRPDAAATMEYFRGQGVEMKVISGDNPVTVAALARRAGITGKDQQPMPAVDARQLPNPNDETAFAKAVQENGVFGRVTPEQKRAMVKALQGQGHTVAMTGDGVNDAMALKDSDLGIAMGSGSAATKAVAQLVLLNGDFGALPPVVAEGRKIIANMERVASLFFAKTTYAAVIAIVVALLGWAYPFLPRHLTIVGSLTIGIPSFVVALAPNAQRYRPGFLPRSLSLAVPAGLIMSTASLLGYAINPSSQGQTVATLVIISTALYLLSLLLRPMQWWHQVLLGAMLAGVAVTMIVPALRQLMQLAWLTPTAWVWTLVLVLGSFTGLEILGRWHSKYAAHHAARMMG
ncbi:hypothetical protein BM477_03840 [Boudabousia marimammalium]|uniref:P-type ATPase A domain-containing protein n=1 Tax=Boudabousia marimammalium TaxID=156892 RepID=A0A1Q5PRP8_9ACTO|nr:hypothetical protein BM477_03840 [Boudabousia marimammalium]